MWLGNIAFVREIPMHFPEKKSAHQRQRQMRYENKGLGQVREVPIFGTGHLPQVIEVRAVTHWGSLSQVPVSLFTTPY